MLFQDIGVRPSTADRLRAHGVTAPNAVQRASMPALLAGRDVVVEAPTGSGKTLAFAIPLVERLRGHSGHGARAMIITPTRELAAQVLLAVGEADPALRIVLCIGGVGYGQQTSALRNGPDVIVACPGRLLDLLGMGVVRLQHIEYLVLDEADEMLDRGFAPDIERIISRCPAREANGRQTVLASATMPEWVQGMIARHLHDPQHVRVAHEQTPDLEHGMLMVDRPAKVAALSTVLRHQQQAALSRTIVFHRTKHGAKKLARELSRLGHRTGELQGNLSQRAREQSLRAFRAQDTDVLVATNVAARGLDVSGVGLVINYELPESPQWLTHRIGRTARNGAAGRAITFLTAEDGAQWRKLRRLGALPLPRLDGRRLLSSGEWVLESATGDPSPAGRRVRALQPDANVAPALDRGRTDRGFPAFVKRRRTPHPAGR